MIYIYIYTWTKQKDSIRIRIHRIFEDSNRKFDGRKSPQLIEDFDYTYAQVRKILHLYPNIREFK